MRVLTFGFFRTTFSLRVVDTLAVWRVVFSNVVLRIFYTKLNKSDSRDCLNDLCVDPGLLPHLTVHSLRKKLIPVCLTCPRHREKFKVIVFQGFAPRFGNNIMSLILIHHLTKDFPSSVAISIAKSRWLRSGELSWHHGTPVLPSRNVVTHKSWPETVISHDHFLLSETLGSFGLAARDARKDLIETLKLPKADGLSTQCGKTITIHIRGGDVFSTNPHPSYTPTPLAFYAKVIRSNHWDKVRIVSEDSNPLFRALISWLEEVGVRWETDAPNLARDIAMLSRSRFLVAGRGTFIPSIAFLSANIEKIFTTDPSWFGPMPPRSAEIVSPPGDWDAYFALVGKWKAEPEQIRLVTQWKM